MNSASRWLGHVPMEVMLDTCPPELPTMRQQAAQTLDGPFGWDWLLIGSESALLTSAPPPSQNPQTLPSRKLAASSGAGTRTPDTRIMIPLL
jgi:hypothetical protein